MARTRATKGNDKAGSGNSSAAPSTLTSKYTLPPPPENPPKIFILPRRATGEARIVSLLHPRYAKPTRYLVCPETGFYEFTRISAPNSTPHSWLIQCDGDGPREKSESSKPVDENANFGTYITNGAELFVATPIDPLFLILPTLVGDLTKSQKRRYVSSDDHFDRIQAESPHLWEILRWGEGRVRSLLEARLGVVCDTVDAGDERVFRFSEDKLAMEVLNKAKRMSARPLPRSMEEKFVVKPLEAPVLGTKRESSSILKQASTKVARENSSTSEPVTATPTPKTETSESQSSVPSTNTSKSEVSTPVTSVTVSEEESQEAAEAFLTAKIASAEIISLQRLRTAFNFLCSSYVPPLLATMLQAKLAALPEVNLAPLEAYISETNRLKKEAAATRLVDDYSRKRVVGDEEFVSRAEKKRKKEDEEKRKKAGESRGVRELKKVNTTGMRKMSDFFTKKA
ncbi:ribonuclease H2, subunit B [Xylaria nigripes]|nr:ribonuclease H2, subunit B [Xylaria nigripes]